MPKKNLKGGRSKKITELVGEMFSQKDTIIEYLPLSSIFLGNLSHKYVHMVTMVQLRNIIDSNPNLKKSKTIMDIYNNKKIIDKRDIYNNVVLTYIENSLIDNVKILFQHIIEYDDGRYIKGNTNIYSVITCNELYDKAYEDKIDIILTDKLFDIRDVQDILEEVKVSLLSDTTFKEIVFSKLEKCSEKPYSLLDFFTNDISFSSNKKCNPRPDELLRLNKQNIVFVSEKINGLSYGDKIKLLILFEHRLALLSKYFSLEILRRKNQTNSVVKRILKKISQLDTNQNKRELDNVKKLRSPENMVEEVDTEGVLVGGAPEPPVPAPPQQEALPQQEAPPQQEVPPPSLVEQSQEVSPPPQEGPPSPLEPSVPAEPPQEGPPSPLEPSVLAEPPQEEPPLEPPPPLLPPPVQPEVTEQNKQPAPLPEKKETGFLENLFGLDESKDEGKGESKDEGEELIVDKKPKKRVGLNEMINEKIKDLKQQSSLLYSQSLNELHEESPHLKLKHVIRHVDNDMSYSDKLSKDKNCDKFKKEVSISGVIRQGQTDMLDCPDNIIQDIIINNSNKHSFFDI